MKIDEKTAIRLVKSIRPDLDIDQARKQSGPFSKVFETLASFLALKEAVSDLKQLEIDEYDTRFHSAGFLEAMKSQFAFVKTEIDPLIEKAKAAETNTPGKDFYTITGSYISGNTGYFYVVQTDREDEKDFLIDFANNDQPSELDKGLFERIKSLRMVKQKPFFAHNEKNYQRKLKEFEISENIQHFRAQVSPGAESMHRQEMAYRECFFKMKSYHNTLLATAMSRGWMNNETDRISVNSSISRANNFYNKKGLKGLRLNDPTFGRSLKDYMVMLISIPPNKTH